MNSRHVIYCDHYPDGAVEAGSNARERKPATVSHEFVFGKNTAFAFQMMQADFQIGWKSRVNVDSLVSTLTLMHISSNFSAMCPDTRKQSLCRKF